VSRIAELVVYHRAPGSVVRCRSCGSVVMVLVNARERMRCDYAGFKLREPA
jgi:ribosomal protein S27E